MKFVRVDTVPPHLLRLADLRPVRETQLAQLMRRVRDGVLLPLLDKHDPLYVQDGPVRMLREVRRP